MEKEPPALTDVELICHGISAFDFNILSDKGGLSNFKNKAQKLNYHGGGMAANAAVAATRLGINTAFSGFISSDVFGEYQFQEMVNEQVNMELVKRGSTPSPVCIIIGQADGNTTSYYQEQKIPSAPDRFPLKLKPKIVLFDGFQTETATEWMTLAKKTGALTVLDAGYCNPENIRLAKQADIVISSQVFAQDYAGSDDLAKIAEKVSTLCNKFIVTLDRNGLLWNWEGETGVLAAWPIECIDGIGAGDAFHATFCAGLLHNLPLMDNLLRASAAGALCCSGLGSREALPDLQTLASFMKDNTQPSIGSIPAAMLTASTPRST